MKQYDEIIVGAGSAGAVIAARLSQETERQVLLLEAGPDYPSLGDLPEDLRDPWISLVAHDWGFSATATAGREFPYPRGKVTGGSSAVNNAAATRGLPPDFDRWVELGNPDWSFAQVLPYYRKLEHDADRSGDFHGRGGPIWIERPQSLQPLSRAFMDAAGAIGCAEVADLNDPAAIGAGPVPHNIRARIRLSTALAYLTPARSRRNLTVRSRCLINRVVIERGRAIGVEADTGEGAERLLGARITICAGAIGTPAILMRSGIGPRAELERLAIAVAVDSPGVGANLIDHPVIMVIASGKTGVEHDPAVFWEVTLRGNAGGSARPHEMMFPLLSAYGEKILRDYFGAPGHPVIALCPALQQPRSRGTVTLSSADPRQAPAINLNMFSHPDDLRLVSEGMHIARSLLLRPELSSYIDRIETPEESTFSSAQRLADFIRANCYTGYHPVATCKMGPDHDRAAVVDQRGRVRGVRQLRIADASIMPNIVSAPTNLTCIMIGERIADWMLEHSD
ncbi:MAG TPA: GMC oxidoreductase [Candidatus Binataceae bacterium]|nr:GMC oxidoreductase [Candidatus Binataceae bacterium]